MWSQVLSLLLILLLLLWLYVRKKYAYFRDRNIIYAEPTFPMGTLGTMTSWADLHKAIYDMYFQFKGRGSIGGCFTFTEPEVMLIDLDVIQDVLVNDFGQFPDHGTYYNEERDPLSGHLYSLTGERWRNMRTKLSPAFSQSTTQAMFDAVSEVNFNLREHVDRFVDQGKPFNAIDISKRYICDSIGSFAFGMNCRALQDRDSILLKIAHRLFTPKKHEFIAYLATYAFRKWADYIPWVTTPKEVQHYFMGIMKETLQFREENNVHRNDFLDMLIEMKHNGCIVDDESGEIIGSISTEELISHAYLLFFVGFYGSRVALGLALYELASNQEIQTRAREEIYRVIGAEGELTHQKLEEMSYIQQIVDETLRKYPPNGYLERVAKEDYRVRKGGHVIEKGTIVSIPIAGIHNDPDIYPAPDRFDPDRMTKDKMRQRHPSSFLPFGGGPRICIGHRFGYLQVKLAIVHLLAEYKLQVNSRTRTPRRTNNFLLDYTVDENIWLNAQRI